MVVDLNRDKERCLTTTSSENGNSIPGNANLSAHEYDLRVARFYTPYHSALENLITKTQNHFGYALFLDLHSFSPEWQGTKREIELGTLSLREHSTEAFLQDNLPEIGEKKGYKFEQNYPYNLSKEHSMQTAARSIEKLGIDYAGLEIRNDVLTTPDGINKIAQIISDISDKLVKHHEHLTSAPEALNTMHLS